MYDVEGKAYSHSDQAKSQDIAMIDNDYQMLDLHVDKGICNKIVNFEYVDFGKLLNKSKFGKEEEGRPEFVTKNGATFLAPAADKDNLQINSYIRWEQAYRVFSNILTTKYPGKATELLQYNHTIHTVAMSYTWENVYSYDKEFRHHISCHPEWGWNVILQQAWTMILKDRLKNDNSYFQNRNHPRNGKGKEICRRFNKGHCSFRLSCRYDHRCSVPKCGKYSHGEHQCRNRNQNQNGQESVKLTDRDRAEEPTKKQ